MKIRVDENNAVIAIIYCDDIVSDGIPVADIPNNVELLKWCYSEEKGFYENPDYVPPDTLSPLKMAKIEERKTKLAEWLANNSLLYSDGKYYSVTEEKQSLLNSNIASYERAKALGIEYPLKWNSTGEECCLWAYDNLVTLSLTIAGYVAPKVSKQQLLEVQIRNCETVEELDAIVIDYDEEK